MYILPISLLTFITPQIADISMASKEEPLLPRLDRLDIMIGYLEEMKGCNRSSSPSTPSRGINTTDGGNSSFNSSPKSLVKHCHPIHTVIVETQVKGNLVDRLLQLEERVSQLVEQLERERESERNKEEEKRRSSEKKMKNSKKGFKGLVKSYMPSSQKPKV